MKFGRAPTTKVTRAGTRGSLSATSHYTRRVLAIKALFWLSLGALLWTHLLYPLAAALLARVRTRRVDAQPIEPTVTVVVAAYNEEPVIARRLENLLALDYPAEKLELVVTSDASTDRTEEIAAAVPRRPRRSAIRAVARSRRRTARSARPRARSSPSRTRTRPGLPTRCVGSCATSPTGGRLRLRPALLEDAAGDNREGVYWRYELAQRAGRVAARLGDGRQRLDLRGPALGLRRGRSEVRPRPRVPVPDGAGRPPRGLRAGRPRVREADADERDRVPAQGAHVRALLADHAARLDAEAASARLPARRGLAPRAPLRERHPASRPARDVRSRSSARGSSTRSCSPGSCCCSRRRRSAWGSPATTSSSRGRPSSRSGTTCGAACPRRGRRRRARAEPRARRRGRRNGARPRLARCSRWRRSRSSSPTAGRCSTARRGSARTGGTSSC